MTKTEQVVNCVRENPGKTSWELARILGWENRSVNPALTHAIKKQYLTRRRHKSDVYLNVGVWLYFAQ